MGGRPDAATAEGSLERALAHWAEHGFGYGVVEERGSGQALGVAGLIHGREREHLNLYYRFDRPHGRGLGPEVARALLADAVEHGPGLPLTATARPDHRASIRTAERAGRPCSAPPSPTPCCRASRAPWPSGPAPPTGPWWPSPGGAVTPTRRGRTGARPTA